MAGKITGFDLDGIISPDVKDTWFNKLMFKLFPKYWKRLVQQLLQVKCIPPSSAIIITGRPKEDEKWTVAWLRENGIKNTAIFNDGTGSANKHKVFWIKKLKIGQYYESDKSTAKYIRKKCPRVTVVVWSDKCIAQ